MEKTQLPDMGKKLTTKQVKAVFFGHLDEYFETMIGRNEIIPIEAKEVYELAVRAFINDISYNGLPTIRRDRYNRELAAALGTFGLKEMASEMIEQARGKRKYN